MTDVPHTIALAIPAGPEQRFLADNLEADGYDTVSLAVDEGVRPLAGTDPAVVVVGCSRQNRADALALVARIRAASARLDRIRPDTAIITLGPADDLESLRAFSAGADDYVSVPFSYADLRARIAAGCRRVTGVARPVVLRVGPIDIDITARTVVVDGTRVELSRLEFDLLRALASDPTRVFTKDELCRQVWGRAHLQTSRTLDSHACRLRTKLNVNGHRAVENVWGVGYRLTSG